ncbi:MAG: DUF4158 domain-containing protein [Albidovulum sp.]|nr:DUF4158 domain-containing protein [Albidovulum sp.]
MTCAARRTGSVSRTVGASPYEFSKENYRERTCLHHQKRILDLQGFRPFGTWAKDQLNTGIAKMARVHLKARLIFGRCIDFLIEKRIQLPGARRLTDLIRAQLSEQKEGLIRLVGMNLSPDLRALPDDLFEQEDGENRYRLTLLSKISQSTRPGKIRKTAADLEILAHSQTASLGPLLSEIPAVLITPRRKPRRSPRAATGSSGIASYAGTTSTRPVVWKLPRPRKSGNIF